MQYQDEEFRFSRKGWMNEDWIYLDGLTSIGETKKTLIIPDEYEGYKVIIRRNAIMAHFVNIKNDVLKKNIYI